jgi:hypothetical protein
MFTTSTHKRKYKKRGLFMHIACRVMPYYDIALCRIASHCTILALCHGCLYWCGHSKPRPLTQRCRCCCRHRQQRHTPPTKTDTAHSNDTHHL